MKAWWDNLGELQTIHPQFKKWTKDVQAITNYHGAVPLGVVEVLQRSGCLDGEARCAR